jgi:hypothetical protein
MSDIFGQSLHLSPVSTESTPIPSWKQSLQNAMQESDAEKLLQLVHATELAIYYRWQELGAEGQPGERQAISDAVNDLWEIKINKLGWPGQVLENYK